MRRLLAVPVTLAVALAMYLVWSSAPTVPLTLTREEALGRARQQDMSGGHVPWTRVESKLVTYRELRLVLGMPVFGGYRGDEPAPDPNALYWVVAYAAAPVPPPAYSCQWGEFAFAADDRGPTKQFSMSTCGEGSWRSEFDLLPDHAWWRLGG